LSDGIGDRQGDAHGFTLARRDREEKIHRGDTREVHGQAPGTEKA
jgi:hypothetical protein